MNSLKKSLQAWLEYLEQSHPITIDLGLERLNKVKQYLTLNESIPIITVAGTNGKGSTCNFLSSILGAAHYNVGLYTSPHIIKFNERIKINNQDIDDNTLIQAFEIIEQAKNDADVSLSYFEFTTLAAMQIFSNKNLDIIILEVGLGGRLDAVNVFEPSCTIITNIGIDHIEYLGNTREKIAIEKAGIFRKEIPAICGDINPPITLIEKANEIGAVLYLINKDFSYKSGENQWSWHFNGDELLDAKNLNSLSHPALRGMNQLQNASCAIMALHTLRYILPVSNQDIRRGLIEIELEGRLTILAGQPAIVLDVAHNAHATHTLADNLDRMGFYPKNIAIFGAMNDKDLAGMIEPLKNIIDEWHICILPTLRSADLEQLEQAIKFICDKPIIKYNSVKDAYIAIEKTIKQEERLIIFGSFYTVAQAMIYKDASLDNNLHNTKNNFPAIKSFVKRGGRTTNSQQKAIDNLSSKWIINYQENLLDINNAFANDNGIILEIGFGMGESTAHIAKYKPENNFLGIEVHEPGVGALLKRIDENNLNNIKIIQHDAVEVLQHMIADNSLSGVHIFFPDPWHKKRHHKRRLIQEKFVALIIKKLKVGGYIHCATDWENYAQHILLTLTNNKYIQNSSENYSLKPSYRPTTKFENRGIKLGHGVWDIYFTKI